MSSVFFVPPFFSDISLGRVSILRYWLVIKAGWAKREPTMLLIWCLLLVDKVSSYTDCLFNKKTNTFHRIEHFIHTRIKLFLGFFFSCSTSFLLRHNSSFEIFNSCATMLNLIHNFLSRPFLSPNSTFLRRFVCFLRDWASRISSPLVGLQYRFHRYFESNEFD